MVTTSTTVKLKNSTLERINGFLQARMTLEPDLRGLVLDSSWDAKINAVLDYLKTLSQDYVEKKRKF